MGEEEIQPGASEGLAIWLFPRDGLPLPEHNGHEDYRGEQNYLGIKSPAGTLAGEWQDSHMNNSPARRIWRGLRSFLSSPTSSLHKLADCDVHKHI